MKCVATYVNMDENTEDHAKCTMSNEKAEDGFWL